MRTIPAGINPMCGYEAKQIQPSKHKRPKMMSEVYEQRANEASYENSPYKQFLINPKTLTMPPMKKDWQEITDKMPSEKKMAIIDKFISDDKVQQEVKDAWLNAISSNDMTPEKFDSYIEQMYTVHKY